MSEAAREWILLATVAIFFVLPIGLACWAFLLQALGMDDPPTDPSLMGSQDVDPRLKRQ